jgi:pimeloyl-ACP methyl ester carboxylesterase
MIVLLFRKKPAAAGFLFVRILFVRIFFVRMLVLALLAGPLLAWAQDYEREKRWSDDISATLMVGDAVWIRQANGHQFLALYTEAAGGKDAAHGAVIIAHGRGWSPDFELYGMLRTRIAELGYTTLSIQLPVLPGTAKLGEYKSTYPDARERFQLAADFLKAKGYTNIAIVSHSLGSTMANQYLMYTDDNTVRAWAFISIINGLEQMFRIKIPVLDVFGSEDWVETIWGAPERKAQILKNPGSAQVMVPNAEHFFEGKIDLLAGIVVSFLDRVFGKGTPAATLP